MHTFKERLIRYIDAGFPIIYIDTFEEEKAVSMLKSAIGGKNILEWNIQGFFDRKDQIPNKGWSLVNTLQYLLDDISICSRKILLLKDSYRFLDDPVVAALLKQLAIKINGGLDDFNIVIISSVVVIPKELEQYISILSIDYLTQADIKKVIKQFCDEQEMDCLNEHLLEDLSMAFKGLSEFEINNILALALSDDGEITHSDLSLIIDQKQQVIKKSGILEMIPVKESLEDIGGLESLKSWLKRKGKILKNIAKAEEFGVDVPKGVLIAGMPGCGKSLNAKATAQFFNVPLLRMDMGRLMGKYVGESESNMRKAIKLAEAISPCVLWIDELEKAFAGIGETGGGSDVTTRLFGTFLTWLQEKDSMAFVVATANDISKMPPELLRKGRFDEIFYVGLPKESEREHILSIHIKKRRPSDFANIDIKKLAHETEGYSGADIEGVIRDSVEEVFSADKSVLTTDDILNAIRNTHSLSEIMKESIDAMDKIYKERKFKNASE